MGDRSLSTETKKRALAETSPITPASKRKNIVTNMATKVADMSVEELQALFTPLATKKDLAALQHEMSVLKEENKALSDRVRQLSEKCTFLENQMESMYMWKNSNNLIVTMNKTGDLETSKVRVQSVLSNLANEDVIVDKNLIKESRTSNSRKTLLKVTLKDSHVLSKVISNTSSLRGTDLSISKDYTKLMRQKRGKLLMLRKFLLKKSNKKLKLQGTYLVDGESKISWDVSSGFCVNSGEPFASVLQGYGHTIQSFESFASKQIVNTGRSDISSVVNLADGDGALITDLYLLFVITTEDELVADVCLRLKKIYPKT